MPWIQLFLLRGQFESVKSISYMTRILPRAFPECDNKLSEMCKTVYIKPFLRCHISVTWCSQNFVLFYNIKVCSKWYRVNKVAIFMLSSFKRIRLSHVAATVRKNDEYSTKFPRPLNSEYLSPLAGHLEGQKFQRKINSLTQSNLAVYFIFST